MTHFIGIFACDHLNFDLRAVDVAQLVEWSLPTSEIRKFESCHRQHVIYQFMDQQYNRKDKNKEKEAGNGPSLKNHFYFDAILTVDIFSR